MTRASNLLSFTATWFVATAGEDSSDAPPQARTNAARTPRTARPMMVFMICPFQPETRPALPACLQLRQGQVGVTSTEGLIEGGKIGWRRLEKAVFPGAGDGLGARAAPQLAVDVVGVGLDGAHRDRELARDFLV